MYMHMHGVMSTCTQELLDSVCVENRSKKLFKLSIHQYYSVCGNDEYSHSCSCNNPTFGTDGE